MNEGIEMQISAFVDGELPENEAELLLRRMSQDLDLRQRAAEYFAIGRALRGQRSVVGLDALRGRVSAAIDDKSIHSDIDGIETAAGRYVRPLAGFAIAASVALAAILGLQQLAEVPGVESDPVAPVVAAGAEDGSYTVPELNYFERHNRLSSESGNNNFRARRVIVQMREDGILETDLEEIDPPDDATGERQTP
jgi:negative regulator of sigma E activity